MNQSLPEDLKHLVHESVEILGEAIADKWGKSLYKKIETLRKKMRANRDFSEAQSSTTLKEEYKTLKNLNSVNRLKVAHSFSLMLELMNACESAYRSHRIRQKKIEVKETGFQSLVYVLTAHPTEAKRPEILQIFGSIRFLLQDIIKNGWGARRDELKFLLTLALETPMARESKPKPKDEAEMLFASLLRPDFFSGYLDLLQKNFDIRFRTWVGGDKDGHPGVTRIQMLECLQVSRRMMVDYIFLQLNEFGNRAHEEKKIKDLKRQLLLLKTIKEKDGRLLIRFHKSINSFFRSIEKSYHVVPPNLARLKMICLKYPAIVIPLELRESSDAIKLELTKPGPLIGMLKKLGEISRGASAEWYACELIVSLTERSEDLENALTIQLKSLKKILFPVVPLFETAEGLLKSPEILTNLFQNRLWKKTNKSWKTKFVEVMLGYSDSSKESGTLYSRIVLAQTIQRLDQVIQRAGFEALYFHGSGGSIERGGGSIREQTEWWPRSAKKNIKITIQGEMVQRNLASPEIFLSQIEQYTDAYFNRNDRIPRLPKILLQFTERSRVSYKKLITTPRFLEHVQYATPYSYLRWLNLGSRPSARKAKKSLPTITSLRAIPWILCWTQTRLLLPAWWGIGSAWNESSQKDRQELKKAFQDSALFRSFIKNLGFSLSKVEMPIWKFYQERFDADFSMSSEFLNEFKSASACVKYLSGEKDLLWLKPWLSESIYLRSSMIHPLNILQILAMEERKPQLLRETVSGISSGMMTTG